MGKNDNNKEMDLYFKNFEDEKVCLLFVKKILSLSITEIQAVKYQYLIIGSKKKAQDAVIALCDAIIKYKCATLDNLIA